MSINYMLLLLLCCSQLVTGTNKFKVNKCNLTEAQISEIHGYQGIVDNIVLNVLKNYVGTSYGNLSELVDAFGPRFTGTANLRNAIEYMYQKSNKYKLENVRKEEFPIPIWNRGKESAALIKPHLQDLPMLGLGYSVGTEGNDIEAEVVVVSSFEELDSISSQVAGKIVVYNEKYTTYGETVRYRSLGADMASKHGAVAALVRSITPFSMRTPHTGMQRYSGTYKKIPVACITLEDAKMLQRRYKHGEKIVIRIKMEATNFQVMKTTANLISDIKGTTWVNKTVLTSGHIDSWDVGEGAMDDGAGAILSWNSLVILKEMGLKPRRTLSSVLWSGEEMGLLGAQAYAQKHQNDDITFVMESDEGTFTPLGLEFAGNNEAACVIQEILKLFQSIETTTLKVSEEVGSDIMMLISKGIPGASLMNQNQKYFWYHHSAADTLEVVDSDALDKCTAFWAAISYVIADLSFDIPK